MADLISQPTPLQTIYGWYRDGSLIVNRAYQRKLVWTLEEKQKLIDSILSAYPVPLVLFAEPENKSPAVYELLDGLQRLHTIVSFMEHGFVLGDGRAFNVDEFPRAKESRENGEFSQLPDVELISRTEVSRILDYILPVSIIRNASPSVITEVFSRINSYGHRLSDQERRQAGLITDLSQFVRRLACEIRGDVSVDTLPLYQMPEISIDLQMTKSGYTVQAEKVFWVRQGVLRSTDLRDSLDEQVLADLTACIAYKVIERSKDVMDDLYTEDSSESLAVSAALATYKIDRLSAEIKYVLERIDQIVETVDERSLRSLIFKNKTTNAYPTVFSTIFLAIHQLSFKEGLVLANPAKAGEALRNIASDSLNARRDALKAEERNRNINLVKGALRDCFVNGDVAAVAYGARRELDIENYLRRSQIETPRFELKQGICRLAPDRALDSGLLDKLMATACAIANIGPTSSGVIFIGVADDEADAAKIKELDNIEPIEVGNRWVVGVEREAKVLGKSIEEYYQIIRNHIVKADLSEHLRTSILANLDLSDYHGRCVIIMAIPSQPKPSFFGNKAFIRQGDQTTEAVGQGVLDLGERFRD
jgi:hypothetical protein